jgi:DNA-binding MarR family transcriptional regulator
MKYVEIIEKMIRLINRINQANKAPSDYGTGKVLYHSEIHMIEAINNHKNVNSSELANILGITRGAVTQVTSKLVKKGFINQYRIANNKKEAYYRLTDLGKIANTEHCKNRRNIYRNISRYLDGTKPDTIKVINTYIDKMIEIWPPK